MPSLFQVGQAASSRCGWGRGGMAGRWGQLNPAHRGCFKVRVSFPIQKYKELKNTARLVLQKSLPKGPSIGGRGCWAGSCVSWVLLLLCSGSFRAKRKASTLGRDSGGGTAKTGVKGKSSSFQPLRLKGKPGKFPCLYCGFLISNLWFHGGKKLWDWISFRNSVLGLLIHFMYCPIWGEGLHLCVGDIIVGNVLLNYYLLKHHLGDTLFLTCSLILQDRKSVV